MGYVAVAVVTMATNTVTEPFYLISVVEIHYNVECLLIWSDRN